MSKTVNITFDKPSSFGKWNNLPPSYVFLSDGSKFLPGVLSYTYTVKVQDNIKRNKDGVPYTAGAEGTYTYQYYTVGPFGPYYDYGSVTNVYSSEGKSTIQLAHFSDNTQTPVREQTIKPRTFLFAPAFDSLPEFQLPELTNETDGNDSGDATQRRSVANNARSFIGSNQHIFSNPNSFLNIPTGSSIATNSSLAAIVDSLGSVWRDKHDYFNPYYLDPTLFQYPKVQLFGFKTYLENFGTNKGTITVSYSYTVKAQNVNTNNNLYVIIGGGDKSTAENEKLGLFISYKCNKSTWETTQTAPPVLKPYDTESTWNSSYYNGTFKIQHVISKEDEPQNPDALPGPFADFINKKYLKYVTNSKIRETNTYNLHGYSLDTASQVSQRSRIYQIPANELNDVESNDLDVKLFYDSSYLCEVSPDIKIPEKDSLEDYNKKITYSYLVSKNTGNITLDGFPRHAYIYAYTFVPCLHADEVTQDNKLLYVAYTGYLKTIGEIWGDEEHGGEEKFNEYVKAHSFKKEINTGKTTYEISYGIYSYALNKDGEEITDILKRYAYTSYVFSYSLRGINFTYVALPFEFMLKKENSKDPANPDTPPQYGEGVDPVFRAGDGKDRKYWDLHWNYASGAQKPDDMSYYYPSNIYIEEPGEYVKLQFSDNEMKTTKDLTASNKYNKITVTSHSNVFYLNIVQTSSSFNSFIPKITTTPDLSFHQTIISGANFGWRFAFVRKDTSKTSSEIYIGVPKFDNDKETSGITDSFDNEITTLYDVCLKVNYSNESENEDSPTSDITTVSAIKQTDQTFYSSTIDVPGITVGTRYFWTDDIFNRTGHEYKNVIGIETASGIEYFGIRAKKHGQYEQNNFRFDGLNPVLTNTAEGTYYLGYDLCGRVVPLTVGKNNDYIYSFKNGAQYLKVNDKWKYKELFLSKISTYEFVVNKEDASPKYYVCYTTTQDERTNINGSLKDLYDESGTLLSTYSTYSISIPFVKTSKVTDNLIIKNSSYFEKTTSTTYEGKFVEVPSDKKSVILNNEYINIYHKDITYTKINPSLNTLKTLPGTGNLLYKYNSYYGAYQPYALSELKKLTSLDNVYEKYVIYKEVTNSSYNDKNQTPYMQQYEYTEVDKNVQPTDSLYYAYKDRDDTFAFTYIPQGVGIVTDDSIKYYCYTYALITDDELPKYKKSSETIYIKENYRLVRNVEDFKQLYAKHAKFYKCIDSDGFEKRIINSSQILDDIDLNGNIIYVKKYKDNDGTVEKAVDISELKELVTNQYNLASSGITTTAEIETRKNLTRRSVLKGKTTFAAENVVDSICVFDYDGKYYEDNSVYENSQPAESKFRENTFYVNEVGYRPINSNLISVGSKQKYYAWRIDRIAPTDIRTLKVSTYIEFIYIDASKFGIKWIFDPDRNYSGVLTNPITRKQLTLAKINSYGFIEYGNIHYYSRVLETEPTVDIFMHPNKVYYKDNVTNTIKVTGTTPVINLTYTRYSLNDDTIKFQYDNPTYNIYNTGHDLQIDKAKYYNNTKTVSYLPGECNTYAYELPQDTTNEFIKTGFLYQTYTINDGIQKSKGGAYYTNIYVFDKNNGAINKTLYLNQHIIDVNAYTYKVVEKTFQIVDNDVVLNNLSPLNYKDYYASVNGGEIIQLDETTESPSYFYHSAGCTLYTYVKTENIYDYSCQSVIGSYQYYNNDSNIPIVLNVDDNIFGIVASNFDISATGKNPKGLSYNMFDLEVVKLYRMSKDNYGDVVQEQNVKESKVDKSIPFSLTNDIVYVPTGSYTWHNPVFGYHTYSTTNLSYGWKLVEQTAGYWTKDYEKNVVPLQIAAYTFYPDVNNISNTSSTYSFVPNSYVLSSVVEYPKIAYDTIDVVTEEQIYYSYVLGGVEQHYRSTDKVQCNPDGTYTGLLKQHIFSKENGKFMYVTRPIQLSQHKVVTKNQKVTNIVNQEHKLDKTFFAYKTSLALTNESVPVLYNTELMPATTKEIQYWDSETASYQLKTVIASYAYYAYQYMYDTIPFKVSSYLFKASYLTIDNIDDLGTSIANSLSPITDKIGETNKAIDTLQSYYRTTEQSKISSINKAYDLISAYVKDGFVELGQNVTTLSTTLTNTLNNAVDKVSYQSEQNTSSLVNTLSAYGYTVSYTIDTVGSNVLQGISEHKDILAERLDTLSSYIKNIVLGETIDIPESMDLVTYNDIVVSYSMTSNTSLDSLGELLMKSFISASSETYSYIDENGYTHNVIKYSYSGLGDALQRIQVVPGIPTKQEFVMDLAPKMFANIDFNTEIVDEVKYDENGNITEKKTHKNNPTEEAKKIIYRAGILWEELAKAGYCKDAAVEQKQGLLNTLKKSALTSNESLKIK